MSNVIYAIPDFVGWTIIVVIGALCFAMLVLLTGIAIKEIDESGDDNE